MFGLLALLVGVWILTYWLYTPGGGRVLVTRDGVRPGVAMKAGSEAGGAPSAAQSPPPAPPEPITPATPRVEPPADPKRPKRMIVEPRFLEYVVERGDTGWEALARKIYGDSSKWRAISRSNPLVTSDRLYPGRTRLRIPVDPDNIQGKEVWVLDGKIVDPPVDEPPAPSPAPASTPAAAPPPDLTIEAGTRYTIQPGDTLWSIAKAFYGKAALWERIHEANRGVITDPNRAPVGESIIIPPP
jgi:nucleoid-associated protein YgaU